MENIMTLPSPTIPKYEIRVPSTGETVSYRPFIVKEEKVLLIALESNQYSMIANSIKDIVNTCTFEKLEMNTMPVFDLCYLFLNIRAKSVGETAEPTFLCQNCECANSVEVNLTDIQVIKEDTHTNKISLGEGLGILMKYPVLVPETPDGMEVGDASVKSVCDCIDMIYTNEEVHKAKDYKPEELSEFVENLTHKQFESILKFFTTMPKISHTVEFKCVKCKEENEIELEGLGDFFL